MLHIRSDVTVHHTSGGEVLRLSHRRWSLEAGGEGHGFGVAYLRPSSVEFSDTVIPVRDHVAIARWIAVAAVVLALISRRFT